MTLSSRHFTSPAGDFLVRHYPYFKYARVDSLTCFTKAAAHSEMLKDCDGAGAKSGKAARVLETPYFVPFTTVLEMSD
jgi:hypothetical protein